MKFKLLSVVVAVSLLIGCSVLEENLEGIAGGGAAVISAPIVYEAIAQCVAEDVDAQQKLKPASEFFQVGYSVITERGADVPIITLIEEAEDYYKQIPEQWESIWMVLDGKNCGPIVDGWRKNSEAAFSAVQKVVAQKDRLTKACGVYAAYGPIAAMFSPIPLPRSVPGCG